jgi:hypothetical protein
LRGVSKDGRTLTWFETRRRAALLTMTVSWAAADRPGVGDGQILGVLERRGSIPFGGGTAAGYYGSQGTNPPFNHLVL